MHRQIRDAEHGGRNVRLSPHLEKVGEGSSNPSQWIDVYRNQVNNVSAPGSRLQRWQQVHSRNPISKMNVEVQEDLPRTGWKVDFESEAADGAISADMPTYFKTSEHFEIAAPTPERPKGVKSSFTYLDPKTGTVTEIDDNVISADAPTWMTGGDYASVAQRRSDVERKHALAVQNSKIEAHRYGEGERNPVLHRYPSTQPMDYSITNGGVRQHFESGMSDTAISGGELPPFMTTSEFYETVNHNNAATRQRAREEARRQNSTSALKNSSIAAENPEWMLKASTNVRDREPAARRRSVSPPLAQKMSAESVAHTGKRMFAQGALAVSSDAPSFITSFSASVRATSEKPALSPQPRFNQAQQQSQAHVHVGKEGVFVEFDANRLQQRIGRSISETSLHQTQKAAATQRGRPRKFWDNPNCGSAFKRNALGVLKHTVEPPPSASTFPRWTNNAPSQVNLKHSPVTRSRRR